MSDKRSIYCLKRKVGMMAPKRELTGQRFGSLTVIAEAGRDKKRNSLLECQCDCGKKHVATESNITSGKTKTCGHCYSNSYSMSGDMSHMIMTFPNGTEYLIDIDDFERVSAHTWHRTGRGYAGAYIDGKYTRFHRFLMNAPANLQVDHINLDKSDNRKLNLRLATNAENQRNSRLQSNNTSGLKGVSFYKPRNKYRARIKVDGKEIHLGYYVSIIEASEAYDRAANHYFGEFARLNNIRGNALEVTTPVFFYCQKKVSWGTIENTEHVDVI